MALTSATRTTAAVVFGVHLSAQAAYRFERRSPVLTQICKSSMAAFNVSGISRMLKE